MGKYETILTQGKRFGSWVVKGAIIRDAKSRVMVCCECDCGTEQMVYGYQLINNKTTQCKKCSSGRSNTKMSFANNAYRRLLGSEKSSSVTPDQILSVYEAQGEVCALTGEVIPSSQVAAVRWNDSKTFSLDNTLITSTTVRAHMNGLDGNAFLNLTQTISEHKNPPKTTAEFFNKRDEE